MKIAAEVGVDSGTIDRYLRQEPDVTEKFLPVCAPVETERAPAITVRGPAGLTIEGLDVDGIAALIRALS